MAEGILNALRAGVKAITGVLASGGLLVTVQRKAFVGVGKSGRDEWSSTLQTLPNVLFEDAEGTKERFEGDEVTVKGKLTIFDPGIIVSRRDKFIVPDGREMSAHIVAPGVVPVDGGRITTEVLLG